MKLLFVFVFMIITTMQFVLNEAYFGVVRWNKRNGEFESIPGLPTYHLLRMMTHRQKLENRIRQGRPDENHNFNRQALHLTYYQELGFVHFNENDTKVSGIYGDLWTTLSEMLNFTLVVSRSEVTSLGGVYHNGSYSGILADVWHNRTDIIPKMEAVSVRADAVRFTAPFRLNRYRTNALGLWQRDRSWMFKQFSTTVWYLVFIFIVILSVGNVAMQTVLMRYRGLKLRTYLFDHIFETFATLCSQRNVLDSRSNGVKILSITVSTFSWLILVGYSARLIYSMTNEVFASPYKNLDSLYENTNFHVVVVNGSLGHVYFTHTKPDSIFDRIRKAKRLTVVSSLEELNDKVCVNYKKYVLLDGDDEVNVRRPRSCDLQPVNKLRNGVPIVSGISQRVENKRSIDVGIIKLREFGITEAIKNRYFPLRGTKHIAKETDSLAIDLDQLSLILEVLAVGVIASVVICLAENIFFALKKRKKNRCLPQRFPVVEHPIFVPRVPAINYTSAIESSGNLYFMELYTYLRHKSRTPWRPSIRDF